MNKIVVRMPNWIGDAVLAGPSLRALRLRHPEAEIRAAGRPWLSDLFSGTGLVHGAVPLADGGGYRASRADGAALRAGGFDAGLLLTNSFGTALAFFLAEIPERWGYAREGRGFLLTRRVKVPADPRLHQRDYYLNLLAGLGQASGPAAPVELTVTPEERASARRALEAAGRRAGRPLVAFGVGAAYGPAKRWPAGRFAELAVRFAGDPGADVLLLGSPGESGIAEEVAAHAGRPLLDFAGRTTLREMMALLSLAGLFVTNDSGPMHIAGALGVPVTAIFGPTDPAATGPVAAPAAVVRREAPCWPCLYRTCPYDHRCMTRIEADDVFAAARPLLREAEAP